MQAPHFAGNTAWPLVLPDERPYCPEGTGGPPQIKPEFDACAEAARSAGVPVREVILEAMRRARDEFETGTR